MQVKNIWVDTVCYNAHLAGTYLYGIEEKDEENEKEEEGISPGGGDGGGLQHGESHDKNQDAPVSGEGSKKTHHKNEGGTSLHDIRRESLKAELFDS